MWFFVVRRPIVKQIERPLYVPMQMVDRFPMLAKWLERQLRVAEFYRQKPRLSFNFGEVIFGNGFVSARVRHPSK
ncbi:hypothetical protein [Mesorhizobium sp. M1163]|uniref:hypothetical protein n=1 Tax=Mesorhizobium sp. M1163 TaxID=2957065 RepID=UPI003336DAC1